MLIPALFFAEGKGKGGDAVGAGAGAGAEGGGEETISWADFKTMYMVCKRCSLLLRKKMLKKMRKPSAGAGAGVGAGAGMAPGLVSIGGGPEQATGSDPSFSPSTSTASIPSTCSGSDVQPPSPNSLSSGSEQEQSSSPSTQSIAPEFCVVVRRMPAAYEGETIRSCNHFQWTWCPGIADNPKCKGSNRHEHCPK